MIAREKQRLLVNINHLRQKNAVRTQKLMSNAAYELAAFQRALKEFVANIDADYAAKHETFSVGLEGSFGSNHVTPRTLSSSMLNQIVCLEGIVTKASLVHSKLVKSVHYCPATDKFLERRYADQTSVAPLPSVAVFPTRDDDGNMLQTEYGLCTFTDNQTFTVQGLLAINLNIHTFHFCLTEMPEHAPPGQLPRCIDVIVEDDLADACKPGDRVQVVGLYSCLPSKKNGVTSGTFRTIIVADNVHLLSKEQAPLFSSQDMGKIKRFASQKNQDVFELLGKSIAPSICGHDLVKKAILCLLLGGVEKILPNGTRIRGDINILLIGDPSVAKSQLLRYVLHSAPRAVATTGRGSSGVGLTAAVTTDQETGDRRLEAGAMVLGDRGIVCIDEFDKMSDIDRTAIHEVMEQGRVTIAKAGIFARLNARCSVLAAANPIYGRYDLHRTPMENIGLQDSLLSRFDLIFIMLDQMDVNQDKTVADHVLRIHRYRASNEKDGQVSTAKSGLEMLTTLTEADEENDDMDTPVFDTYNAVLQGASKGRGKQQNRLVNAKFMRKYIHVARSLKPQLTESAIEAIVEEFAKLRSQEAVQENQARTQPITARTLETMIRLATAHAKSRLSKTVDLEDAEIAISLVRFAYFKEVIPKKSKKQRRTENEEEASDEENMEEDVENDEYNIQSEYSEEIAKAKGKQGKAKGCKAAAAAEPAAAEMEQDDSVSDARMNVENEGVAGRTTRKLANEKNKQFRKLFSDVFQSAHVQTMPMNEFAEKLRAKGGKTAFTDEEIEAGLDHLASDSVAMVSNGVIFLV